MLKFVHSRPPRARSSSPAGASSSLDRASPRQRDRSYPPFPPMYPPPREGEMAGGLSVPRPRMVERGGRVSPASSRTSTTTTTSASPARSADGSLGWEGDYDQSYPAVATYPARDRGRISYPPHPDLPATRRHPPAPDRGRARHSEWPGGSGGGRLAVGDRDRERQHRWSPVGRYPAGPERQVGRQPDSITARRHPGTERDKPRTSSPRDRHVRISPYPVEEIPRDPRSSHFPAPERDRSVSPASSAAPQSILAKPSRDKARAQQQQHHHQQLQNVPPPGTAPLRAPIFRDVPPEPGYVRSHSAEGSRAYRERSWGPEDEVARQTPRPRALTEPSVSGNHRAAWARPHVDREEGPPRGAGPRGKEGAERGREWEVGAGEGEPTSRDRLWKPKLFFSGSWLHGPSRHRIFASKSAQPSVMTTCVPQVSNDLSNEALNKTQSERSVGQSSQGSRGIMSSLRDMLNRSQEGTGTEELLLDMTYVTERIISMSFPSEGHDTTYAFNLKDVVRMLKTKHGDNYLVLNLSEKRQDLVRANPQVKDYGWPDHLAPPLERLCSVCKAIDAWLHADARNVVVLHCKGGRARIAIIIAAYMHYSNICASADQALDRFAMKRFYEDKLGGLPLPSQRRYLHYFAGLLSGAIKINTNPLYLHHILIHGVPNFDTRGGCRPFIKVYQGMQPIFMSGVYNVTDNMQKVCISISPGIPLRGDILIKCYHKKARTGQREVIWQCQFHTCAIQVGNVVFSKPELDDAIHDPRFPDNGKVEFVFGPSSDVSVSVSGFKSDVTVPVDDNEENITRSDSYENFYKALALQGAQSYAGPRDISYGSHQQQAEQVSSGYTSQVNSSRSNYNSSTLTRSGGGTAEDQLNYNSLPPQQQQQLPAPTLDERSQLDELLSDLLSDQLIVTSPKSPQSPSGPRSPLSPVSPQPTPSGAKTMTTATHSYSSYSSTDGGALRSPRADAVIVQRADLSHRVPGQVAGEPPGSEKGRVPKGAFSYTPTSPTQTDKSHTLERDMTRTDHVTGLQQSPPSRTQTLPYRADYENRYNVSETQHYNTMDGEQMSWLQQQQQKLQRMRDGRDATGRTEQEKQLVSELKLAQNRYFRQRAHSEAEEQAVMDSYRHAPMHNGPVTPTSAPASYAPPPREFGGETGHFNTFTQSQSHFENHFTSGGERSSNKPPPSPTMQRPVQQAAPVQPPVRSSSKDYMRSRSQSSSSHAWQASSTPPPANRPLVRQYSETLYDREQRPIVQAHHAPSSQSTPPLSPRALSPTHGGPGSAATTYTTYRTIHKEVHDQHHPRMHPASEQQHVVTVPTMQSHPPPQSPQHPQLSPGQQAQHNYITEVFVHRVGAGDKAGTDRTDSAEDTRLDELTRSLQAASHSIVSHTQQQQQQQQQGHLQLQQQQQHGHLQLQPQQHGHLQQTQQVQQQHQHQQQQQHMIQQSWQEHQQTSQVQKTHEEVASQPVGVVEEDRFSLRPIGPGMQTLEPSVQTQSTSTLTRSAQPTSPETPPFPVSPGTAVQGVAGGSSMVSPTGTLTSQTTVQQQQQQQQQYQYSTHQHQEQQKYQQQRQQADGSLHIDTSQRMLSPGSQARSPSSAGSPQSPGTLNTLRQELSASHSMSSSAAQSHSITGQSSPSVYFGLSRRGSLSSLAESEMIPTTPKFVKDMSKYWYKPNITREEAITLLKDRAPGTFVIRDSNSFPGAYGLALKVAQVPANVQTKPSSDPQSELVRHFLIEPTPKGVRLRGCSNEPIFGSLASLVYQHSITPLALPCKLVLPDAGDSVDGPGSPDTASPELNSAAELLAKGAACTVIFLNTVDTESLTGPQAIAKAIEATMETLASLKTTEVHFKVSSQGITLTDINRKLFFRRHYPVASVTYCGMDSKGRRWKRDAGTPKEADAMIFGFVARKQGAASDNSCHLFAELEPNQPASAIVNFITKVMIGHSKVQS